MMTSLTRHLRLIAALVVLGLATSGCGFLGGGGSYEVRAELTRSFNLFPGSPVKVLGVTVGQITDIVVPDGARNVEVIMDIQGDVDIPADTAAIVMPASLLGERYVQLAAYTDGPLLTEGAVIPVDRTAVPFEFDEVMTGLENFVGGLEGEEVGRFVANLAETLDGQGAQLGRTIDSASEAIGVLRDNDTELIALASRLADLNETLSSRDQELARLLQDFDLVAASLVGDRGDIDAALTGLVRVTSELDGLLQTNRARLEGDIEVLTRVGRTVQRNLDNVSDAILYSAELFRHAERIIDRERGYLPLQNQTLALGEPLTESIIFRLQGLCLAAGLDDGACELELLADLLGGLVCAAPIFPCVPGGDAVPLEEALLNLVTNGPEGLGDAVLGQMTENRQAERDEPVEPEPESEPSPSSPSSSSSSDADEPNTLDRLTGLFRRGDGGDR
jgi:phospholipid/cholesterol/gamma-HCH transport system substrate-binding protein